MSFVFFRFCKLFSILSNIFNSAYMRLTNHLHPPPHTPLNPNPNSSALAHEKAFNQMRSPQHRLEKLMHLDAAHQTEDKNALAIDKAEVDFGKRKAQLDATSEMLKERSVKFLETWTPRVADVLRGLSFAHHDILSENALMFGEGSLSVDDCDGSMENARRDCEAYLMDTSVVEEGSECSDASQASQEGRVAPHTTPAGSSLDIAADAVRSGKGKAKARAA